MALYPHFPTISRAEGAVSPELKLHNSMGSTLIAQDEDTGNPRLVAEAENRRAPGRGPGCRVLKEGRCS